MTSSHSSMSVRGGCASSIRRSFPVNKGSAPICSIPAAASPAVPSGDGNSDRGPAHRADGEAAREETLAADGRPDGVHEIILGLVLQYVRKSAKAQRFL